MDRDHAQPDKPSTPTDGSPSRSRRRRWALHTKILMGLAVGAAFGIGAHLVFARPVDVTAAEAVDPSDKNRNGVDDRLDDFAKSVMEPIGRVFLRLVMMVVVPLVFSALALGVLELGDLRHLGRVGVRTLAYTALLSGIAVTIGITLVYVLQPGKTLSPEKRESLKSQFSVDAGKAQDTASKAKPLQDTLLDIIPENPLQEMVGAVDGSSKGNGMLAVMFFSLSFGAALAAVGERGRVVVQFLEGLFDVSMAIIGFAMQLAPYGVACLVFAVTARLGADILTTLVGFVGTTLLGLGLQLFVVYPLFVRFVGGRSPREFFSAVQDAMLTAFGTSSSNATLPTSLHVAEKKLKLPPKIARFVLTVGATANQNGTALYEGVVVLFLAQVFGVDLSLGQQVSVVLMSVLAGIGTAGVPGGSLPLVVVVLRYVDVPGEAIAIVLGVDRLLDMCRTVLNVTGDLALATGVARGEAQSEAQRP